MRCREYVALIVMVCALSTEASAVKIKQVYSVGEDRFYGISVTTRKTDSMHDEPLLRGSAVFRTTVRSVLPDGSIKMRVQPIGAVLNGKRICDPERFGRGVDIKLNRYGKIIAVDAPSTQYTDARTVDLQPYMSREWRTKPWIPDRDIRQGESWTLKRQDATMKDTQGTMLVTLASERENVNKTQCCRFDMSGTAKVRADEMVELMLSRKPEGLPQGIFGRCSKFGSGLKGQANASSNAKCWFSLTDGGVIAASSTTRSSVALDLGPKMGSRHVSLSLVTNSKLRRLSEIEAESFLSAMLWQDPQVHQVSFGSSAASQMGTELLGRTLLGLFRADANLKAKGYQSYSTAVVGISLFDLLPMDFVFDIVDLSVTMPVRVLPEGSSYGSMNVTFGLSPICLEMPLVDFFKVFIGAGYTSSNLAESVKPGHVGWKTSAVLLFGGLNASLETLEIGLDSHIVKVGASVSVCLSNMEQMGASPL